MKEKEFEYRDINWSCLVVLLFTMLFGFSLAFFLGYAWGEWVYPFILSIELPLSVERAFALLLVFLFVWWTYRIYKKIAEEENELYK